MHKCLVAVLFAAGAAANTIWPKPQQQSSGAQGLLTIDDAAFDFVATGATSSILSSAFKRYRGVLGLEQFAHGGSVAAHAESKTITSCAVNVLSDEMELSLETDEHYNLTVSAPTITITAASVFAAIRGLESLAQLVDHGLAVNATAVVDFPRYAYRGFMIDTSRHYYPVATILMHLDAMAYSKFNVLHWHLVDSVSFPFESVTFPEMSQTGAYSPSHVYTPQDVARIVTYAAERGIRVIPEFDTPGHVEKGYAALSPAVLTQCYDSKGAPSGTGPLNPTLNATYDFLTSFFSEIKQVFPDKFVHVGGDEVPADCWASNPEIKAWIAAHPTVSSFGDLEQYYELELLKILNAQGTSYICWQEIFDNGVKILPDTVVEVWKGGGGAWQADMSRVSAAGFHSVLSAPFYLNYISYGEDWPKYYTVEPSNFTGGEEAEKKHLVGGTEVCMWSEFVDASNFISRSWPRAAAVGERGWSAKTVRDVDEARVRIAEFRCKLIARGLPAEPITNGGSTSELGGHNYCPHEWEAAYRTPWNS